MGVANVLFSSALVGSRSGARAGVRIAEVTVRRTPLLVLLGARAAIGTGSQAATAQAVFRDELLTLLDDAAEIAWREARHARVQLDLRTSPAQSPPAGTAPHAAEAAGRNGARRHRVKA